MNTLAVKMKICVSRKVTCNLDPIFNGDMRLTWRIIVLALVVPMELTAPRI